MKLRKPGKWSQAAQEMVKSHRMHLRRTLQFPWGFANHATLVVISEIPRSFAMSPKHICINTATSHNKKA